jgi:hypothetical protein
MGEAGRKRAVESCDYRVAAKKYVKLINEKIGIS